jgi:hypothetical protein
MPAGQQQPHISWKDRAIAKSEVITDAWEVTKAYAGRIAEWVLFGCMVANIIEILPGVTLWPFVSSLVLGTQAITLDIAGFGLASMADHARRQGDEQAAQQAELTGHFLIGLMLVTLLLVSVGILFPVLKPYTDMGEKGLILLRVVMTVIYGHVLHGLRRLDGQAQQQQQQQVQDQVTELLNRFREELQGVQSQVQGVEQAVHQEVQREVHLIHREVQQALEHLPEQVQDQLQQALQQRLNPLPEQRAEHYVPGEGSAGSSAADATQPHYRVQPTMTEPPEPVHSALAVNPESEPLKEEVNLPSEQDEPGVRVQRFISEQLATGRTPTLKETIETCQCSKNTAIRHRRVLIGNGGGQEPGHPKLAIVRAQ